MNNRSPMFLPKQKGYILITTLVLMIIITVLAVTQVSLNSTQTRIATNATDSEISFEKTEGAINEASNSLISSTYNANSFLKNSNGLYLLNPSAAPLWTTVNWSSPTSVINSFNGSQGAQSSYIIEQLPSVVSPGQNLKKQTRIYRATARAATLNGNSSVLIQSTIQIQQ